MKHSLTKNGYSGSGRRISMYRPKTARPDLVAEITLIAARMQARLLESGGASVRRQWIGEHLEKLETFLINARPQVAVLVAAGNLEGATDLQRQIAAIELALRG